MRSSLKCILTGAALFAGVAALTPALAGDTQPHVLTIAMPDGSVQEIRYSGDVPPRVILVPAQVAFVTTPSFGPVGFGPSFAMVEQMAAMFDRQAEAMMRQVAAMRSGMGDVGPGSQFPGAQIYSMSTTVRGNGVCMRRVQITYNGDAKPQVVSNYAGNCGPTQTGAAPAEVTGPRPTAPERARTPRTIEVRSAGDRTNLAMARPVFVPH